MFCRRPVSARYTCTVEWCAVYITSEDRRVGAMPGVDRWYEGGRADSWARPIRGQKWRQPANRSRGRGEAGGPWLRTVQCSLGTPVLSAKLSRTLASLWHLAGCGDRHGDTRSDNSLIPEWQVNSDRQEHPEPVRMMISQFWNLCRACPALDVDKVSTKCQYLIVSVVCRDVPLRVIQTIELYVCLSDWEGLEHFKWILFFKENKL